MKTTYHFLIILAIIALPGRQGEDVYAQAPDLQRNEAVAAYKELLSMFPEDRQGYGEDHFKGDVGDTGETINDRDDQPMTYGLVLSAEALRLRSEPGAEAGRRVRKAVRWLLDNRDLDGDGKPGWGLPQPWDTFTDGTINPANHPYTITTSIVLNGLLDALQATDFWTAEEEKELRDAVSKVVMRWCREFWLEGYGGGFFRYSPSETDNAFCVNASSMFLGSLVRALDEQKDAFTADEQHLAQARADRQVESMVATVEIHEGEPYWRYVAIPNNVNRTKYNDILHHVYTLWGVEIYRERGGRIALTWSREQAVSSVYRFFHDGNICHLPYGVKVVGTSKCYPTRLWGAGALLAFSAQWGTPQKSQEIYQSIRREYGPWPKLRWKGDASESYPRHTAHVLQGLALHCFAEAAAAADPIDAEMKKKLTPFLTDLCDWIMTLDVGSGTLKNTDDINWSIFANGNLARTLLAGYKITGKRAYLDEAFRWADTFVTKQFQPVITSRGEEAGYWAADGSSTGDGKTSNIYLADAGTAVTALAVIHKQADPVRQKRYIEAMRRFSLFVRHGCKDDPQGQGRGGSIGWVVASGGDRGALGLGYRKGYLNTVPYSAASSTNGGAFHALLYALTKDPQSAQISDGAVRWILSQWEAEKRFSRFTDKVPQFGGITYNGEGVIAAATYVDDSKFRELVSRHLKPCIEWLLKMQNADGTWGKPETPDSERSPGVVTLLAWYYRNVDPDERIAQAVEKNCRFLLVPESSERFGVKRLVIASGFVGLAMADLIQPGVTF